MRYCGYSEKMPKSTHKNGADTDDARYLTIAKIPFILLRSRFHFVCETSFVSTRLFAFDTATSTATTTAIMQ